MIRKLLPIGILRLMDSLVTSLLNIRDKAKNRTNLPEFELSQKHLKNAKLLTDRDEFLMNIPQNGIVGEVGVDVGNFTSKILELNSPKKLHLIDNWNPSTKRYKDGYYLIKDKFENEIERDLIQINRGLSTDILPSFEDNYFDWLYIDTVHDYEVTIAELRLAEKKVKVGGIIAGHDYTTREKVNGLKYGVIEAVHEFCVNYDWEIKYLTIECSGHNSFAIQKIV